MATNPDDNPLDILCVGLPYKTHDALKSLLTDRRSIACHLTGWNELNSGQHKKNKDSDCRMPNLLRTA